jgi:hypothetical protein
MKSASDLLAGRPDRIQPYPPHAIAERLPSTVGTQLVVLTESVRAKDLQDIVLFEGKILDGRELQETCQRSGVVPRYAEFDGPTDGAWDLVFSRNLERAHWSDERTMIASPRVMGSNQHHSDGDPLFLRVGRISLPLLSTLS